MTFILIYLAIGIVSIFVGPMSKDTREFILTMKEAGHETDHPERYGPPLAKWKIFLGIFLCITVAIIFYPVFYIEPIIDYLRKTIKSPNHNAIQRTPRNDKFLYFDYIAGIGDFFCRNCTYSRGLTSAIHGFMGKNNYLVAFQCQECGNFTTISNDLDNENGRLCTCGGQLSRDKPIFCPQCKSKDVEFSMNIIT